RIVTAHDDALHVDELTDADTAELAAVARALDAAERQSRIRRDHSVDEHEARLELIDEATLLVTVPCPRGAAEPEHRVVRDTDRIVAVACAEERRDRTEQFVPVRGR